MLQINYTTTRLWYKSGALCGHYHRTIPPWRGSTGGSVIGDTSAIDHLDPWRGTLRCASLHRPLDPGSGSQLLGVAGEESMRAGQGVSDDVGIFTDIVEIHCELCDKQQLLFNPVTPNKRAMNLLYRGIQRLMIHLQYTPAGGVPQSCAQRL